VSDPQNVASDPGLSAFVTANAGSGKTRTLVSRVARILLRGVKPEAVLCVTYTKAAAAEMQKRLFETLGGWAVMDDQVLSAALAEIGERPSNLSDARALFARALETPGGLKIQTLHAFCEKLLRRFPLEAGVAPGFQVLEDQAAREVSAQAREDVARAALQTPDGAIGQAYARFSVELHFRGFQEMFADFEAKRAEIEAYVRACTEGDGVEADVWRRCGFAGPEPSEGLQAEAVTATDWAALARAAEALRQSASSKDRELGENLLALGARRASGEEIDFDDLWRLFCTKDGKPLARMATKSVEAQALAWLGAEQQRLGDACDRIKAARVAEDTVAALQLASLYATLYESAKEAQAGLDFTDLIALTHELLTGRADAAWVLYKLDGGIDHLLVDEAQDTAPSQWDIVDTLTAEFFAGAGARPLARTTFAVGDEKQSIFSFQGADPARFLAEAGKYEAQARAAGARFERPSLIQSFRSTPEVLAFVDAVFGGPAARRALRPDGQETPIVHQATRPPGCGTVDLWPLDRTIPSPESDAWETPVDAEPAESGNRILARRIAREIKSMVERGEAVSGRDGAARRIGYGDVLILVRRRSALFHEIIRALKREGVPVGGADRLTLSDHIVFHDLIALARFCLYPQDDLTLAALLRSPLMDVDEGGLFDLAWSRKERRSLWSALIERGDERPDWRAARELLQELRRESRQRPPFDFYARLLSRTDSQGRSMRARIATRLGREADEALEAFLAEALKAERRGMRDLESFADDMASVEVEVKREQEDGKGEVRVMTAHGAKGLEAPVVILPDTTTRASLQGGPLLQSEGGGFLWSRRKADDCQASAAARQQRADKVDQESLRLLYVALTRARDRLIVCGVEPAQPGFKRGSWREAVEQALQVPEIAGAVRDVAQPDGRVVQRFGADAQVAPLAAAVRADAALPPAWIAAVPTREGAQARYASPSQMAEAARTPSPSPLASTGGLGRFRRGDLIHRLLQLLPDVAPARRRAAAAALLEKERDLTPEQRTDMASAAMGVLEDERFAAVFGPGSRAEVAIAGGAASLPGGTAISGRIDRLVVEPDRVLVADFKTNRPSPGRIEDADEVYITQMAVYAAALREAFPGRRIEAALVWTDGPKLMPVPENLMAKALEALPRSG
jgi:ATP-dependent helicase/nuclease subunit A